MKQLSKLFFVSTALIGSSLQAAILFTVPSPDQTNIAINMPFVFAGTIANDSGASISSQDLFFSFSGLVPNAISLSEASPGAAFTIPNGAVSSPVNLFAATLLSGAQPNVVYQADVVLQDIQGDLAPPVTVSLSSAPEPASFGLLLLGMGTASVFALRAKGGR